MEKTHKIDVVSIRLVEEPPLYSSKTVSYTHLTLPTIA